MYEVPITILAGTTEDNPKVETLEIEKPFLNKVEIEFPAGCCGYVKLRIYYGIKLYWPLGEAQYFSSDDHIIIFHPHYTLPSVPMTFRIVGWSPDATYNHTITCRFEIRESMEQVETSLLDKLNRFFQRIFYGR